MKSLRPELMLQTARSQSKYAIMHGEAAMLCRQLKLLYVSQQARPSWDLLCAGSAFSNGLAALTHPVKLRLSRAAGIDSADLRDYSANVVLIEPLATMTAVEDFLAPRIRPVAAAAAAPGEAAKAEVCLLMLRPALALVDLTMYWNSSIT